MRAWLLSGIRLPLAAGAAAVAVYAVAFGDSYSQRLLTIAGCYALLVIGYQFIFGYAGALSLAQGAFFGIGAYTTGILGSQLGWGFLGTFPLSIALPTLLAAAVAMPVMRLESHYFALATLAVAEVVLLAAVNWESLTGGANGIAGIPGLAIFGVTVQHGTALLLVVWGFVAAGGWLAWRMTRGLLGLAFHVARDNDAAALSLGIDTGRLRFVAFLFSAAYGGAAGALYAHTIQVVSPEVLQFPLMVACLAMAVIGGRGRVSGAVIGALLLVHLPEWFRFLSQTYLIAYGGALLAAVIAAPSGIVGALERLRRRLAPEFVAPPPAPLPLPEPESRIAGTILAVEGASLAFGGVKAVDDVSFAIGSGQVIGMIGPNGSGKTTLVNLITGVYRLDRGRVRLGARDVSRERAFRLARLGVARSFQTPNLVDAMTALDNVAVARLSAYRAERGASRLGARLGIGLSQAMLQRARGEAMGLLTKLEIAAIAQQPCGDIPHGLKRQIELARALALAPALLVLDEPAAGLSEAEQAALAKRLRALSGEGLTLLIVEHNMPFLLPLADRVICLEDGRVIAEGAPAAIRADRRVIEAYLGTAPEPQGAAHG